jgi:hypothetical protein
MRFCLPALLLFLPTLARAGEGPDKPTVEEMVKALKEVKALLATVKDKKTAEAARPKLLKLSKRLAQLKELQAAFGDVARELDRLAALPPAAEALRDVPLVGSVALREKALRERARIDVKTLTTAVETYYVRDGVYPASLQVLTQKQPDGGAAFLSAKALIDPWGRPYVYEPGTLHPTKGTPLIYSHGPRPGDKAGRIANWSVKKKAPPKK